MLSEGVCSIVTGRPQNPLHTILYTNGHHEPLLIRQSFPLIRHNAVNVWTLHDAFEQLKYVYADKAGMDVALWKQCLLSLFFGASTEKTIQVSSDDAVQSSIYAEMCDWCNKNDT
jgi:hypothetical protein